MKSAQLSAYGPPENVHIEEADVPVPAPNELLVEVVAASVNSADVHMMRGDPFLLRLAFGFKKPKIKGLGADVAGRVQAVGSAVKGFAVGDQVMAELGSNGMGGYAEHVCAPASVWQKKPARMSFVEAAATPMAGMTALKGLRDVGKVKSGERVLVIGAAGGVGSFGLQIARALGAKVTAVARADKAEWLRQLGVGEVLAADDFEQLAKRGDFDGRVDVIFDCAAYKSPFRLGRLLGPGGRFVLAGGSMLALLSVAFFGLIARLLTKRKYKAFLQTPDPKLFKDLLDLVESGQVRPLIDRTFPLEQVRAALSHVEDRKVRGKAVITIGTAAMSRPARPNA